MRLWLALVAALVALTGAQGPTQASTPSTTSTLSITVPSTTSQSSSTLGSSSTSSTASTLTLTLEPSTSQSSSTSVSSSTSGIVGTSSTQGQAHHVSLFHSKGRIVVGCVLGGFALIVLTAVMIRIRHLRKKGAGPIEPVVSALNQYRPQGRHDNVTMSDTRLWENSTYNEDRASGTLTVSHDPIHSLNLANSSATLAPFRREYQPPQHAHTTKNRDELRAVRQSEINQRLQAALREMMNLTSRQTSRPSSSSASEIGRQEMEETEVEVLRAQIRQLKTQIEQLQMERSSDWAQGLSDDSPPPYNSSL